MRSFSPERESITAASSTHEESLADALASAVPSSGPDHRFLRDDYGGVPAWEVQMLVSRLATLEGHRVSERLGEFERGLDERAKASEAALRRSLAELAPTSENMLVSGGDDLEMRLWDARARTATRTLHGHPTAVNSVAWSTGLDGDAVQLSSPVG